MTISATTQGIKPGVCLSTSRPVNPFDGQVIYMTDVDQTAVWDGTQWTVLAPIAGGRNAIINGAMNVWQRGTNTGTLGIGGGSYVGPDRWWFYNNAFTSTISRQSCGSTLPQFQYCTRIQRTSGQTGTTATIMMSPQETINSVRLAGKTATLSFYARASSGISTPTALIGYVHTGTGTDEKNFGAGYTGGAIVMTSNPTLTTSWQRFSVSAAIPSTTTEVAVQFQFWGSGTAGASDYVEFTGVQLEEGAVATPFEFEDYGTTLAKCQRYYFRVGGDSSYQRFGYGTFTGATSARIEIYNPVTMRSIPSSIESSTIALYDQSALFSVTAFTLSTAGSGKNLTQFDATVASGGTTYRPVDIVANASTSAYIGVNAEL